MNQFLLTLYDSEVASDESTSHVSDDLSNDLYDILVILISESVFSRLKSL
jgi:hypothetical protein